MSRPSADMLQTLAALSDTADRTADAVTAAAADLAPWVDPDSDVAASHLATAETLLRIAAVEINGSVQALSD